MLLCNNRKSEVPPFLVMACKIQNKAKSKILNNTEKKKKKQKQKQMQNALISKQ